MTSVSTPQRHNHWGVFLSVYDQIKQALFSPEWIQRFRRSDKDFTRTRDFPFHRLVTLLLNLRKGRTEQELNGFFATLEEQPLASATPTVSAFCKARQRLLAEIFPALNRVAIDTFRAGWATPLWHGFRLLAVDGTTLRLPYSRALERYFGAQASGPILARASMLYDLGHALVVDLQLAAHCVSERELAIAHLEAARPRDLLLYDRGYPAFWLMVMHGVRGVDFCMRLARDTFSAAQPFWDSAAESAIITLTPSRDQVRDCRAQGLPVEPIRVRLVRVRLPDGETEVLAVKSPKIIDALFEELGPFCRPLLERLNGGDVAQGFLRNVLIVDLDVLKDGLLQALRRVESGGGQHLGDTPIEALDHAVGLGTSGRDEPVLDGVGGADLIEGMAARGLTLAGGAEAIREFLAVVGEQLGDGEGRGGDQACEERAGRGGGLVVQQFDVDPAGRPIDGGKEIAALVLVGHLRQVFDINVHEARRIGFEGLCGRWAGLVLGGAQGLEVGETVPAQAAVEARAGGRGGDEFAGNGQQVIERQQERLAQRHHDGFLGRGERRLQLMWAV